MSSNTTRPVMGQGSNTIFTDNSNNTISNNQYSNDMEYMNNVINQLKSQYPTYNNNPIRSHIPQINKQLSASTTNTVNNNGNNNNNNNNNNNGFNNLSDLQQQQDGTCKRKILIIATGGTIVMSSAEVNGPLSPQKGLVASSLSSFQEVRHRDMPLYDVQEWENPIDSSDITPDCIIKLALQIYETYYLYDGWVILCGTDTMAYLASQLAFLFENLSKTVVLTGAMIPLGEPVSDAKRNLLVSMISAANLGISEVLIFFNTELLRGTRAKKTDPWRIAAFESPSQQPLAKMGVGIQINSKLLLPPPSRKFFVHQQLFSNIITLTITPTFSYASLRNIAQHWQEYQNTITQTAGLKGCGNTTQCPCNGEAKRCNYLQITRYNQYPVKIEPPAVVLLLYGSGNAPVQHREFGDSLDMLLTQGCPVVVLSQCLRGSTSLDTYEGGAFMKSKGVIDGLDMTIEACTAKLAYLMGRGLRGPSLKLAMESPLRGELTRKESISYTGYTLGSSSTTPADLARL